MIGTPEELSRYLWQLDKDKKYEIKVYGKFYTKAYKKVKSVRKTEQNLCDTFKKGVAFFVALAVDSRAMARESNNYRLCR